MNCVCAPVVTEVEEGLTETEVILVVPVDAVTEMIADAVFEESWVLVTVTVSDPVVAGAV